MKLGIIISMYDEKEFVEKTINSLKDLDCKFLVIQSDPGDKTKHLEQTICHKYELMSDFAGGIENYKKIVEKFKEGNPEPIGPMALTRNYSRGFSLSKDFDVDYVVGMTGDVYLSNIKGTLKIIEKMKKLGKHVAGTRTIGYTLYDENGKSERFQDKEATDIMPQFFIADMNFVKKGLFTNIVRTNKFNTEQCLGDEIKRFCKENDLEFFQIFYSISDYAYPKNIEGVHYNADKLSKMPHSIEKIVNAFRRNLSKETNKKLTRIFERIDSDDNN